MITKGLVFRTESLPDGIAKIVSNNKKIGNVDLVIFS